MYKSFIVSISLLFSCATVFAQDFVITSPNKQLTVKLKLEQGKLYYDVAFKDRQMLEKSPLGLRTHLTDLSQELRFLSKEEQVLDEKYEQSRIKTKHIHYQANELTCHLENVDKKRISVIFRVSNNDIAFRYHLPQTGEESNLIIEEELSGYKFPQQSTTFLTPQAPPMSGWKKTKPSYEEEYVPDEAMGTPSKYGLGYTFPALFHIGDKGWVLLSETGVNGQYCASKLSEGTKDGFYQLAFPHPGENNGIGRANPTLGLPGYTPWRTLTVGETLQPIVETTIPFDVVKPLYEASTAYSFGRSTWSWLMWQDNSINYADQKTFIDLASDMRYEFTLIDGMWDTNIGRDKIKELVDYAAAKEVGVFLWYNSNGFWNDAPQTPKQRMNTTVSRKQEMAWMKQLGVKGIKVDFFGGDKQETIQLYEDILSDANDYGLMVIFHGCTLPRGWERMYSNFVGSEAVLASENLIFTQHANDTEAYNATLHPFIRNSVASMEFGPVLLNKRHNRGNNGGQVRKTSEIFQLATAVLFQSPVQNFGITPNNLKDMPVHVIDFMKNVPTTWDETILVDGYPGKYVVLARRHGDTWYIAGVNAEAQAKHIKLSLPMLKGKSVVLYADDNVLNSSMTNAAVKKDNTVQVTIQPQGGVILVGN